MFLFLIPLFMLQTLLVLVVYRLVFPLLTYADCFAWVFWCFLITVASSLFGYLFSLNIKWLNFGILAPFLVLIYLEINFLALFVMVFSLLNAFACCFLRRRFCNVSGEEPVIPVPPPSGKSDGSSGSRDGQSS